MEFLFSILVGLSSHACLFKKAVTCVRGENQLSIDNFPALNYLFPEYATGQTGYNLSFRFFKVPRKESSRDGRTNCFFDQEKQINLFSCKELITIDDDHIHSYEDLLSRVSIRMERKVPEFLPGLEYNMTTTQDPFEYEYLIQNYQAWDGSELSIHILVEKTPHKNEYSIYYSGFLSDSETSMELHRRIMNNLYFYQRGRN